MKKVFAMMMALVFLLLPYLTLSAIPQFWLDEVENVDELKQMFPDMYFFDLDIEIFQIGAMRDNSIFMGCREIRMDHHGYYIVGTIDITFMDETDSSWIEVSSNLLWFGVAPEFAEEDIHGNTIIDDININIYSPSWSEWSIWFEFEINFIHYLIRIDMTQTSKDNIDDFIVMLQDEVLTPAIVGRQLGGDA